MLNQRDQIVRFVANCRVMFRGFIALNVQYCFAHVESLPWLIWPNRGKKKKRKWSEHRMQKNILETPHLFAFVLKHHHLQPGALFDGSGTLPYIIANSWKLNICRMAALSAPAQEGYDAARQTLRRWLNDIQIYRSAEKYSTPHLLNSFFLSYSYSGKDLTHTSAPHFLRWKHRIWHSNRSAENIYISCILKQPKQAFT